MILEVKPRDSANAQTSEVVDLMARSASIKQSDDTSVLSKGERAHGMFGALKHLNTSYLYQKMNQSHAFVDCNMQSIKSCDYD